jgi:hypothetical protein
MIKVLDMVTCHKKILYFVFFVVTHYTQIVSYDEYKQLKRTN